MCHTQPILYMGMDQTACNGLAGHERARDPRPTGRTLRHRGLGMARARFKIGMANLAYNFTLRLARRPESARLRRNAKQALRKATGNMINYPTNQRNRHPSRNMTHFALSPTTKRRYFEVSNRSVVPYRSRVRQVGGASEGTVARQAELSPSPVLFIVLVQPTGC